MHDLASTLRAARGAVAGFSGEVATRPVHDIVAALSALDGLLRALLPALREDCLGKIKCRGCFFSSEAAPSICAVLAEVAARALCAPPARQSERPRGGRCRAPPPCRSYFGNV